MSIVAVGAPAEIQNKRCVRRLLVTASVVPMKNGVFWVVTLCGSCNNRRFRGIWRSFIRVTKIGELGTTQAATSNRRTLRRNINKYQFLRSVRRLLVAACVVPSS
jgi:hypothetical protein